MRPVFPYPSLLMKNEADVAVALQMRLLNQTQVIVFSVVAQRLLQIVLSDMRASHGSVLHLSIPHQHGVASLEDRPEAMRMKRHRRQHPVQKNQHYADTQGREKRSAAIDGTTHHRAEDDAEHHIECRALPHEAFVAKPDHENGHKEYDECPQRHLPDREVPAFD